MDQEILKFDSHRDFEALTNNLAVMTSYELDSWEQKQSFVSFRTSLLKAYSELDTIKTYDIYRAFLMKYRDILTEEDGVLVPKVSIPLYQAIVNIEGLYETNGYINKVFFDYVFSARKENISELRAANFEEIIKKWESKKERPLNIEVFQISGFSRDRILSGKTNAMCTTYETASYFYNQSNCRNDREVKIIAKSYITFSRTYEGDWRQPRVLVEITALRRTGTFCKWILYDTNIVRRNVSFSIMAWTSINGASIPQHYDIIVPNRTTSVDTYWITWDYPIGTNVLNQSIVAQPFLTFYGEATSRGVDGNWAVLSCN